MLYQGKHIHNNRAVVSVYYRLKIAIKILSENISSTQYHLRHRPMKAFNIKRAQYSD